MMSEVDAVIIYRLAFYAIGFNNQQFCPMGAKESIKLNR
jgi:hypothetical protein